MLATHVSDFRRVRVGALVESVQAILASKAFVGGPGGSVHGFRS